MIGPPASGKGNTSKKVIRRSEKEQAFSGVWQERLHRKPTGFRDGKRQRGKRDHKLPQNVHAQILLSIAFSVFLSRVAGTI